MTQVKAYAPGPYARSADRGPHHIPRETELREFLSVQRESGMDYFSDGLLFWPDPVTPLARRVEDSGHAGSNREAVAAGTKCDPLEEPYFQRREMPRGRWISTLPSPLALSRSTRLSGPLAAEAALSPQLEWLAHNGCAFVVLQEREMPGRAGLADTSEALERLESPLPLVLRLPPGDAAELLPALAELPVEAVGADMTATSLAALPQPFPRTLLAGIVDTGLPEPEEPARVAARHEGLLERLAGEADLHLAPNGELHALTPEQAARKVRALGDAARILRGG